MTEREDDLKVSAVVSSSLDSVSVGILMDSELCSNCFKFWVPW